VQARTSAAIECTVASSCSAVGAAPTRARPAHARSASSWRPPPAAASRKMSYVAAVGAGPNCSMPESSAVAWSSCRWPANVANSALYDTMSGLRWPPALHASAS
jgi:hypothetical protein